MVETPDVDVEQAARIAASIELDPEKWEAILEEEGMTPEEFEHVMYDIATDSRLTDEYEEALGA